MEKKIKEVENYFKGKILSREFTIESEDAHNMKVLVDNKYEFNLWIANGARGFGTRGVLVTSFMHLEFTEEEQDLGWTVIGPIVDKFRKEVLLEQKREEYFKLKDELEKED